MRSLWSPRLGHRISPMRLTGARVAAAICCALGIGGCGGAGANGAAVPAAGPHAAAAVLAAPRAVLAAPAATGCPARAVYVRLDTELRGYPLGARGVVAPCARISGPLTQLVERGDLAIGMHGELHSLSFQNEDGLTVHAANANGDAAPIAASLVSQDHVALAVDSHDNDFVVASENYAGDNCWFIVPRGAATSTGDNCDPNVGAIFALGMTTNNELVVAGTDIASGRTRLDFYVEPATSATRLVRTISGPATRLPTLSPAQYYFSVSYALATDPRSGDLYVYDSVDGAPGQGAPNPRPEIVEFRAGASGNVAPLRELCGAKVKLPLTSFAVNVLSTDDAGNLYVLAAGPSALVEVFGPHAAGNAAPDRTFADPTALIGTVGASLAVRTGIE